MDKKVGIIGSCGAGRTVMVDVNKETKKQVAIIVVGSGIDKAAMMEAILMHNVEKDICVLTEEEAISEGLPMIKMKIENHRIDDDLLEKISLLKDKVMIKSIKPTSSPDHLLNPKVNGIIPAHVRNYSRRRRSR